MNELEHPGPLWPRLLLFAVVALVVLSLIGTVLSAVFSLVRTVAFVAVCAAVIWAIVAARRSD